MENSGVKNIIKTASFLAVATAITLGLFVIALPQGGSVEAREDSNPSICTRQQVALDEGYGVSRVEWRMVCEH
jgi:hypothetical protein